ncbi:M16 family metallopeptidase [Hoylesella loescheii]|uniref:Peptidase M16 inactive domain protein n=1 Tax=Hoylesella loescheii DSM 19665 = JCM 12249 = ATCC 15930 TaxID=1122985 RepID=A0A069QJB0_HOYLO|nr:insulinase family protein [Hoylesella loescheii]KDR52742.1 peptidase M16 inactive domain protein [Hoylesella loescheii DSM 19665 = JCM 12249 = ATCC 15930]
MSIKSIMVALLLTGAATAMQAKDYKYQTVKGDPTGTRIYTLDNGLRVYLSVNKETPRIHTYVAVKTGSRNDPAETTGLAHYLEHLMFKGTKQFGTTDAEKEAPLLKDIEERYEKYRTLTDPEQRKRAYHGIDSVSQLAAKYFIPNEYDKLMSSIGAEKTNAYTSNDVTCYTEDIPANEVDNWAKIQADRFQNMVIRGFHTELEAVYEEYNIGLTRDGNKEWEALSKLLMPTHPYGTQTTIGTQEHLKNPSIVNIKNYFNRYYVPNNVAICMAGDMDPEKVIATIDKYFGSWKRSDALSFPQFPKQKPLTAPKDTTVVGPEAENIVLAWGFDGGQSLQSDTLDVIANILSNGKAGLMDINLSQKMKYLGGEAFAMSLAEYGLMGISASPKEGQSLDEVKKLVLGEVENLKKGNFPDELLPAVINNMKLEYYHALEKNQDVADQFVDAFIKGREWQTVVGRLDRISKMTKAQIVAFANKYLNNNYALVYKRQGEDTTQKKIDKPQITPIPSNRDLQSDFVKEIISSKTTPIEPRFVDFNKDLVKTKTKKGLPVLYVPNKQSGLFTLSFRYDFGLEADKRLPIAVDYLEYLGTNKLSPEQVKQRFYQLACDYSISAGTDNLNVTISGLNENMPKALWLVEHLLANAKVDKEAYMELVELVKKSRKDNRSNQNANFGALAAYGIYGPYNKVRNVMSNAELDKTNPQTLLNLLKGLRNYKHEVLYCGQSTPEALVKTIDEGHVIGKTLANVPQGKRYTELQTKENEVWMAPYEAKNIYMMLYNNSGKGWNVEQQPMVYLFNEYFGTGMNGIVFQELRETRGLAYNASARYTTPSRVGGTESLQANIISQNDKMMDCVKAFNSIIDEMPQSDKAFELAKQASMKRIATERTTKFGIINAYLQARRLGLDFDIKERIYNALPKITLKEMVEFEKQAMAKKPLRYLILGDEKNLDMKGLEKIGKIKKVTTQEIFGY